MDVDVAWLMEPAATMPLAEFEEWYLGAHAEVAKRLPGLTRYSVSRLVDDGWLEVPDDWRRVHRVAQLHWDDVRSAATAFASYEGLAAFGDNLVNTGSSTYTRAVALTRDQVLPVDEPAGYDILGGGFRRGRSGATEPTTIKVHGYGFGARADLAAYVARQHGQCPDPRLRAHVVGAALPEPLAVGRIGIPAPGVAAADWSLEWWFDSVEEAREAMASAALRDAWRSLAEGSDRVARGIYRSQELYLSLPGLRE